MGKVFIDTNIFLGLYETNNNNITNIFVDISKLKDELVFSQQVFDEFLRNRDTIVPKEIKLCNSNTVNLHTTALLRHLDEFQELNELKNEFKQKNKELIKALKKILDNIVEDPIFVGFRELYEYDNDNNPIFARTDEIIQRANERLLMGNPPIDKKKGTIGDQIIWETLLENMDEDLIFITEDKTYFDHKFFLEHEYFRRTTKRIHITNKVSFALSKIGETPSQELKEFETSRAFNSFVEEDEVKDLLSHFSVEGIDITPSVLYEIFEESEDSYEKFMEILGINEEIEDRYRKPYHSIHSDYISIYRKYFNPEYSPYIENEEESR